MKESTKAEIASWARVIIAVIGLIAFFWVMLSGEYSYSNSMEYVYNLDNPAMLVSGNFILGSGYIDTEPSYMYYIRNSRGNYELNWVPSAITEIAMDENTSPYLIKTYERYCMAPLICRYVGVCSCHDRVQHVVLHVPTGTITQAYSLGAK